MRHCNSKEEVLRMARMKKETTRIQEALAWSANMLMSLYILRDSFHWNQDKCNKYVTYMYNLNESFNRGEITIEVMQEKIFNELGMVIEMPR